MHCRFPLLALLAVLATLNLATPSRATVASPWRAEWIWQPTPTRTVFFRRVFAVEKRTTQAKLAITCDNAYTLFINGMEIAHDDDWMTLETYDIKPYLRPGSNVVAVQGTDFGPDAGALLVEGCVNYADGTFKIIKSDPSWRMSKSGLDNWQNPNFDDSKWSPARSLGKPPVGPWGGLIHTDFTPKVRAKVSRFVWPRNAAPGSRISVSFQVTPERRPKTDGPVGVRLLCRGETVFEQWGDQPSPLTTWRAGEPALVRLVGVRLPEYLPAGRMEARVLLPGMVSDNGFPVNVSGSTITGNFAPALVSIDSLQAEVNGRTLSASVRARVVRGGVGSSDLYLRLFRGKELLQADTLAGDNGSVLRTGDRIVKTGAVGLDSIPPGEYLLRVCPHRALCTNCPARRVALGECGAEGHSAKPLGRGVFTDHNGIPHRWHISRKGVMFWDGKPYIPVGGMYLSTFFGGYNPTDAASNERHWRNDIEKLTMLRNAGITDIYLNPCVGWEERPLWVWQRIADLFDQMGFNYGVQVTQETVPLTGYLVSTEQYTVAAPESGTYGVDLISAFVIKFDTRLRVMCAVFEADTGRLIRTGRASVRAINGGVRAEADVVLAPGQRALVHFIPQIAFDGDMHDYWAGVNAHYFQKLDRFFDGLKLGQGFRLFIDPLDNEQSFREAGNLLPDSDAFRSALAQRLKSDYRSPSALATRWALDPAVTSFEEAARLVPVGRASDTSDDGWAADFGTGRHYHVNMKTSRMWYDIVRFRDWSVRDYNNLVADRIKAHHDAPIVQKLTDLDGTTNDRTSGGFDGVGMEAYGSDGELVRGCGGGVYSRSRQAARTIWELVTETGLAQDYVGYPDPLRLFSELGSMVGIGAKGTFYFYLNAGGDSPGNDFYIFNLFCDTRQLAWMGAFSRMLKSSARLVDCDPQVDYSYPAMIAGQYGFRRADPDFSGTTPAISVRGDSGRWVVPATTPPPGRRVIVNLEDSPATEIYGPTVERLAGDREVVVIGHRRNPGAMSFDRYFTPEFAGTPDGRTIQVLKPVPEARTLGRTDDGKVYWMQVGNLTIYSKSDWEKSVKEVAGSCPQEDVIRDVLGARVLDLGPAFQGVTNGMDTYLWLVSGGPCEITVDTRDTITVYRDGHPERVKGPVKLRPKPRAESTEHIVTDGVPRFAGIERANQTAARALWRQARDKALKAGLQPGVEPSVVADLYAGAARLEREAEDVLQATTATRMPSVTVDGDLSEWAGVKPIHLGIEVIGNTWRERDYPLADFYLGWDDDNLYVAARVTDDKLVNNYRGSQIWNGDNVELFIDTSPASDPSQQSYTRDTYQFLFSPTNADGRPDVAVSGNPGLSQGYLPKANRVAATNTADGWAIECAVKDSELGGWRPKAGARIGFTVGLDDSNRDDRERQFLWRGRPDTWRNRTRFARLVLAE